jgi:hypothetical protein
MDDSALLNAPATPRFHAAPVRELVTRAVTAALQAPGRLTISTAPKRQKPRKTAAFVVEKLERVKRFERSTPTLARLCSTPELHPLARLVAASDGYMAELIGDCNREKWPPSG